jgi:hypothetical protein
MSRSARRAAAAGEDQIYRLSRRRLLIASAGGFCLAVLGLRRLPSRRQADTASNGADDLGAQAQLTVLAFVGALFGTQLSERDLTDLSDRLKYRLTSDATFGRECAVLAQSLDSFAEERGATSFTSCDAAHKESIVNQIMAINYRSVFARFLSRLSNRERNYYRMRWATVWQLAWLYQQSGAAWRHRGYIRWPGVPGDWREILSPGSPYP